jgi:aminopeptidase N
MYEYTPGCYYEQVYVQGSRFVDGIRDDMGNAAFWSVVRAFWKDHKYQITDSKSLLDALLDRAGDQLLPRYRKRFPSLYGGGCPCHGGWA